MHNKVRHYRYLNDEMTQMELSQKTGVSRQTIIAIEKGSFNPSVKLALKIARVFKTNVEQLFMLDNDD